MTPTEQLLEQVAWAPAPNGERPAGDIPHATHSGVFEFAGVKLRCYRLSNGQAVFDTDDLREWLAPLLET